MGCVFQPEAIFQGENDSLLNFIEGLVGFEI